MDVCDDVTAQLDALQADLMGVNDSITWNDKHRLISIVGACRRKLSKLKDDFRHGNLAAANSKTNPTEEVTPRHVETAGKPPALRAPAAAVSSDVSNVASCVTASVYLLLESLVVRSASERALLYLTNERTGILFLSAVAGTGMTRYAAASAPPSSSGVVGAVMSSGIAVNLNLLNLEDAVDCPGPSKARNAIFFPVHAHDARTGTRHHPPVGVIALVNKHGGAQPYNCDDEMLLHQLCPCFSYFSRTYPHGSVPFDPSVLHRVANPTLEPQVVGGACDDALSATTWPDSWTSPRTQLVYHREGAEKFIRRQHLRERSREIDEDGIATHLRTVEEYISSLEACWRDAVTKCIEADRTLVQRHMHLTDAQDILYRKQRKLDLLKDVLQDTLQRAGVTLQGGPPGAFASSASTTLPLISPRK